MRLPRRRWVLVLPVLAAVVLTGLVIGLVQSRPRTATDSADATSVPACSWPLKTVGDATREQIGLIRCYIRAVDHRDLAALSRLVTDDPAPTLTAADVSQSRDAQSGTATATFTANAVDSADMEITVRYADGASADLEMHLANPQSAHSWRLINLGTYPSDSNAPPPAQLASPN